MLHSAAIEGDNTLAESLLEKGADINVTAKVKQGDEYFEGSLLHLAAKEGNDTLVELLLKKGATY